LNNGIPVLDLLTEKTNILPSKGEARKMVAAGGVSINKEKCADIAAVVDSSILIGGRYLLIQKGKKNYFLVKAG
ncbi:MAG: tyrosine--tRNA ligase, partial [Bacteroidota bacterium]